MDDRVIPDVISDVISDVLLPQGRYTESFVLISLFYMCKEWQIKKGASLRKI